MGVLRREYTGGETRHGGAFHLQSWEKKEGKRKSERDQKKERRY